jgi:protein SCO1/2
MLDNTVTQSHVRPLGFRSARSRPDLPWQLGMSDDGVVTFQFSTSQSGRCRSLATAAMALALLAGCSSGSAAAKSTGSTGSAGSGDVNTPLHGRDPKGLAGAVAQSPATPKPSFTLPDTAGVPFNFATATQGKVTLLYFGYTNCPDVCPATMAELSGGYDALPKADRANVKVVFVTTDPARDTGPVLKDWLSNINPDFIGLVGTADQTNAVLTSLQLPPVVHEAIKGGGYAVDHIAVAFAFTNDNKAHVEFTDGVAPDRVTHDLKLLLRGWHNGW